VVYLLVAVMTCTALRSADPNTSSLFCSTTVLSPKDQRQLGKISWTDHPMPMALTHEFVDGDKERKCVSALAVFHSSGSVPLYRAQPDKTRATEATPSQGMPA
jgi:hypothetical protein